ncbi:UNVERIFIED_CONTAM: hypothetical protein FKN15_053773 [Acipenser sinensis]
MTANKNAKTSHRAGGNKAPRDIPDRCPGALRAEVTMTANKNAKTSHRAGGNKAPRDIPDRAQLRSHKAALERRSEHQPPPRKVGSSATVPQQGPLQRCQSASPPPISSPVKGPAHPLSDSDEPCWKGRYAKLSDSKLLSLKNWSNRASTLRSGSTLPSDIDSQNRLLKSVSIGCLDTKLSLYKPLGGGKDQKENHQEGPASDGVSSNQLGWSTLCLGPASNHRSLSLSRSSVCSQSLGIRKKISEWECRKATPARMSLCLDKRPLGDRVGNEVCPSLLSSPCSEKTFDFKGVRRMSRTFSECSYPETEEEEALDKEPLPRFEKRLSKIEPVSAFLHSNSRKETSAVLNRIQKIEQALKDSPSQGPPQFLSNCYGADKVRNNSFTIGSPDDAGSVCNSIRGSFSSVVTEPDSTPGTDKVSKMKQRFSVSSESSYCPELLPENPDNTSVNPVPKPKRTFEYEADSNHKSMPSNGLSPTPASASPPPLPSTPAPPVTRRQKKESIFHRKVQNRKSLEFEDASSLQSSHTPSPTENGSASPETRSRFSSKSTLAENAYEDIVESPKENPYEDVDLKGRSLGRKTKLSSENSLHRMWTLQDRKYTTPPQLPSKPSSQSLRLPGPSERKSHRLPRLSKRHSHDDMLLLPQLSVLPPSCRLNEDSLSTTSELSTRRPRRVPKLERPTKQMREAEGRLKAIPQFCFPDVKDWTPVLEYSSETFSFMLTGEDGSRRFGYCRRLLPSGKGPRLPEVYCVISRLGCFDLFSKILDEVERRREVSAALVYPFMRSLMESPFPAPGKTIKVKTFLPGAGNEVIELRRPMDSRLEHVDFDSLFRCLSVRQVIRVFASLLLERRVIFVADKLSILSSCVHAVVALLYPFSWQHTFIPVLPSSIVDIVCCPTPFLVGLLSSSLPKLKELPVEEALMVDLGTDRFIRQDTLLPRKLQAALEQALEQKNDLMNQDSDSESDEGKVYVSITMVLKAIDSNMPFPECDSLSSLVSEAFIRFFLETIGHYSLFLTQNEKGERVFQREAFRKSVASKSIRRFLGVFMESQMFAGFIQDREMRKCRAKGLFEQRVEQYLEELPDTEQSGVNKFLKGLGDVCCTVSSQTCLSEDAEENIFLKDHQKAVPDMDKLYCQHHNREPLCLFCETCAMLTCSSCHLSSHKNHRLFHVGKAIQNQQRLFESLTAQVEDKKATMKNSTKQIESRLHDIKVMHRKTENQIQMAKMIMMNEINKRANVLLEQLERITDHYKLSLEYQQHGIVDLCQQLEQVQNFINWATAHDKSIPFLYSQLTTDTAHQGFPDNANIQRPQPLICQGLPAALHHRPVDQANEFQPCFQQPTPVYCGQCHHRPQALQEHLTQQCMHLTETNRGHTWLQQQNPMGQQELEQGRRYRRIMPYPMKTIQPWKVPQQAQLEQDQQAGMCMGTHLQMKQLEQNTYPVSCTLPSHSIHQQMHLHRAPPRMQAPQTHMAQQEPAVQLSHLQQMQLLQQRQMQTTEPLLPDHAMQHVILQPSQLEQMQKGPKVLLQTQEPKLQLQHPAKPQQFQQARVGQINYIVRQQPVQPQNGVQQQSFQPAQDNGRVQQTEQLQQETELHQHDEKHGMTHASVVNQIIDCASGAAADREPASQKMALPANQPLSLTPKTTDLISEKRAHENTQQESAPLPRPETQSSPEDLPSGIHGNLATQNRDQGSMEFKEGDCVLTKGRIKEDSENTLDEPINLSVNEHQLFGTPPMCSAGLRFAPVTAGSIFEGEDNEINGNTSQNNIRGEWVCSLCRNLQTPEMKYDCENTRLIQEHKGKRPQYGLSLYDQRKCERLILYIYCNTLSLPFHEPVSPLARHYYQIIKKPMDLSVIRSKLNKRSPLCYYTTEEFVADVFLMFRNCAKFNYVCEEEAHSLAVENKCHFQEVSAAEHYQEILTMFIKLIRNVMDHLKYRADRRSKPSFYNLHDVYWDIKVTMTLTPILVSFLPPGMLVVNVTWRNKTYVGTLLDCTRHDWAPPRFCESPTSDLEMRNGRGRGKRMRPNSNTPVNENSNSSDTKGSSGGSKTRAGSNSKGRRGSQTSSEHRTPPNSNTEDVKASPSSANKRKSKPASDMEPNSSSEDTKGSKRMRTNSNSSVPPPAMPVPAVKCEPLPPAIDRNCPSPVLIDCPHPNCNKKYKHMNGLKYHQARAHNDEGIKQEMDGDSEYGEDSTLHPEPGSCNGASVSQKGCLSPARSVTPKGRGFEGHSPSPSPGKFSSKQSSKKKSCDTDQESVGVPIDDSEDGPCLTDEASNDGMDDKKGSDKDKSKKPNSGSAKPDKVQQKSLKSARPIAPAIPPQQLYTFQTATFTTGSPGSSPGLTTTVVQAMPKSPQLKAIQPKPTVMGEPSTVNPSLNSSKDKKKKDKKKKESKDADSPNPVGKGGKPEEGKSPYSESSDPGSKSDGMLNGSSDPHQSRLASIKAEADKIYSFSDNAPSPLIGVASRLDSTGMVQPMAPLHVVTQNGADNSSVKTNSPAYSDISDAGEDGEGKADSVKAKADDQAVREGAKKTLFPSQTPSKESPFYSGYEAYYSPNYTNPSPGASNSSTSLAEGQPVKVKKEEEPEPIDTKVKVEPPEERKPEVSMPCQQQQPSVIQQRSNMYMQPLYYNQYAYVPPYGYSDQAYHAHLMASNPAYRQQYEEHQRQRQATEQHRAAEKKSDMAMREREAAMKEEWKQKASIPPILSKAPSITDLGKPAPTSKPKDSDSEPAKSVIIPKVEDSSSSSSSSSSSKIQSQQAEGLKMKLSEGSHHSKEMSEARSSMESSRQPAVDQAMWYRQEPDSRMWPYVYPNKYPDSQKQEEEQRWKEERERERKGKEERPRPKETAPKEENKESMDPRLAMPPSEDHRSKDPRSTTHMQFTSHLAQHQSYMPYIHGYPYAQGYDPNHPGYRGMPSIMMQNYPERKPEVSMPCQQQQPSVIQQRSNMYMQPLYYNQYAYVPPYGYSDQAYHAHLMASNPAYRQQYEEHQRQRQATEQHRAAEKKSDMAMREREAAMKEEWKQKASIPPILSKAPSITDLGKPAPTSKPKDSDSEPAKSVIIPKVEDSSSSSSSSSSSKIQSQQAEGLKMKLSEGSHHSKEMSEARSSMESSRQPAVDQAMWYRQEPDSRMWPYVYPNKYPDSQKQEEEQRWKEERERERKGKEERPRPKETAPKEENKESMDPRLAMPPSEDHRSKDPRSTTHMQFTSHLAQHQSYMPYIHGYPYAQGYDPNHPGYRGMPSIMMQNYPGSYLSSGYSFSPYGNKMPGSEEGEKSRSSPTVSSKSSSESKALDILQQHASHYKSKSPTVSDKQAHERERAERERDERPRSSPSQRLMTSHHHLGYPLQYDLPYAAGLSSSAIIASQQASAPSLYPPPRR